MDNYSENDRRSDFEFFTDNYLKLFKEYGHKFLAIKGKHVLGAYDSVSEAIDALSDTYKVGSYIIQECSGDESAYTTTIMSHIIKE